MSRLEEGTRNLLVFHTSAIGCAFSLEAVQEIVPMVLLSSPPGMPLGLAGFLDLRGTAIPILRLDRLFDLPEQLPGLYTPFIILHAADTLIGVLVGSVQEIVSATAASVLALPEKHVFQGCATATVEVNGQVIYLLSAESMLIENERRSLTEFQAVAQMRLRHLEQSH